MEASSFLVPLSQLLNEHGVQHDESKGWLVPNGRLPAIRATWYPRENSGVLQVDVLLQDNRIIEECFAGFGEGSKAQDDAFHNFCVNSFHVMLAAFWGSDDDQIEKEVWEIGGKRYTAYIGNFGKRTIDEDPPAPPPKLFEHWENGIKNERLTHNTSWFRFYVGDVAGDRTFEALKENQEWSAGKQVLESLPWKASKQFYSVRNFLILKAHPEPNKLKGLWTSLFKAKP